MAHLPTGTVTFLFTDIEGSTKLWERSPQAMSKAIARHDEIIQEAIELRGGYVFKTVGDAFCAAFPTALGALEAALAAQRSLWAEEWGEDVAALRVRMALHTGAADERGGDYFGQPVNRVARLLSAGHGGQILLSLPAQELVRDQLPDKTDLRALGERRLKDLTRPERVFQLVAPDLPTEFPPLRTLEGHPNNLPPQPTPLVGRERAVDEVLGRLLAPGVRLLTLTGPGGTGKTRLGLQVAAEVLDEFEDGAFFVPLAAITDPELVPPTIAKALGVRVTGDQPVIEGLKDYLRERELFLLLDNFEQILEAAPVVTELLSAPRLKVLVTSRMALRLYGESEYAVPPLELPDPERLPDLERLTQYEAVRLFIERARAAKADFAITNDNAPAVAEICARLDGLPLAIELAAARIKLLPPRAILNRLSNRLKLLTGGARDLPTRQRTLRGAIEWSYALLEKGERMLFARLAIFVGGCRLEAIEAICDAEGDLPIDVLEGVSSLLDKSLLRQEEGPEDEPRFLMLETIREYALERLEESSEAKALARRHAGFFLALAEEAEPTLEGTQQQAWLERLELEHDNLRAALSWALEADNSEVALRMGAALGEFWYLRGYLDEGRGWLEEALSKPGHASAARARALGRVSWLAFLQGDLDRAEGASREGLELEGVELFRTGGQDRVAAELQRTLGIAVAGRGDYEQAARWFAESLAISRQAGNSRGAAISLFCLGIESRVGGDFEQATELYEEALTLCRESGDPALLASILTHVGYTFVLQGELERATRVSEEAAAMLREQKHRLYLVDALSNLGWAALLRGDPERAKSSFEESIVLCRELGSRTTIIEILEGLACAAGEKGQAERAARLFGVAEALGEAVGYQHESGESALREPYLTAARSRLDGAAWQVAWTKGRAMTFEEAVAYALEDEDHA